MSSKYIKRKKKKRKLNLLSNFRIRLPARPVRLLLGACRFDGAERPNWGDTHSWEKNSWTHNTGNGMAPNRWELWKAKGRKRRRSWKTNIANCRYTGGKMPGSMVRNFDIYRPRLDEIILSPNGMSWWRSIHLSFSLFLLFHCARKTHGRVDVTNSTAGGGQTRQRGFQCVGIDNVLSVCPGRWWLFPTNFFFFFFFRWKNSDPCHAQTLWTSVPLYS